MTPAVPIGRVDHLVWGREDLAITVLGEPAAGTAVGM